MIFYKKTARGKEIYKIVSSFIGDFIPRALLPIGSMLTMKTNIAPSGYLICDGSEIDISEHPELIPYLDKVTLITGNEVNKSSMIATASSSEPWGIPSEAINNNPYDNGWFAQYYQPNPWFQVYFSDVAKVINGIAIRCYGYQEESSFGSDAGFSILGSNDGTNYTTIANFQPPNSSTFNQERKNFTFENNIAYRYIKLQSEANHQVCFNEIWFYENAIIEDKYFLLIKSQFNLPNGFNKIMKVGA